MKATERASHAGRRCERSLRVRAPAKLNLTLRVLGKREDGYHELESLMVAVDLFDELMVERREGSGWRLCCEQAGVPVDEGNLVLRAARELSRTVGEREDSGGGLGGFEAALRKRIPLGAGLGGGSSDAAAALRALNRLYGLGLSDEELVGCAARVGSDVPFFFHQPAAVVRGRGERVEPVGGRWPGWFLVVCPPLHCASGRVYAHWKPKGHQVDRPIDALAGGERLSGGELAERFFNELEGAAFRAYPQLGEWHRGVQEVCRVPVRLTGSGAALFCPLDGKEAATELAGTVSDRFGFSTFVVQELSDGDTRGAAT